MKRLQGGKDVTDSPGVWTDADRILFTVEEAAAMLPDRDTVNVKLNNTAGFITGADWTKAKVLDAMSNAYHIEASGPLAAKLGLGLHFLAKGGNRYFVETRGPVDVKGGG